MNEVYEFNDPYDTWDGYSLTGQEVPDGVYFYIYSINGTDYKGTVSLMRSN